MDLKPNKETKFAEVYDYYKDMWYKMKIEVESFGIDIEKEPVNARKQKIGNISELGLNDNMEKFISVCRLVQWFAKIKITEKWNAYFEADWFYIIMKLPNIS